MTYDEWRMERAKQHLRNHDLIVDALEDGKTILETTLGEEPHVAEWRKQDTPSSLGADRMYGTVGVRFTCAEELATHILNRAEGFGFTWRIA